MASTYKVYVNDNDPIPLSADDIKDLDIVEDGEKLHLLDDNRPYKVAVLKTDFLNRSYTVKVNGNKYEVDIKTELDQLIKDMGLKLAAATQENEVHAPMPGLILSVDVSEGESVEQGEVLCVLEAMKMENALTAPADGVIKKITIEQGQTVEKNALLIELDLG